MKLDMTSLHLYNLFHFVAKKKRLMSHKLSLGTCMFSEALPLHFAGDFGPLQRYPCEAAVPRSRDEDTQPQVNGSQIV